MSSGRDPDLSSQASIARGLAIIAVIASAVVFIKAALPWGKDPPDNFPACDVAVAVTVLEDGRERLGCTNEPVLAACGRLAAGDKLILGGQQQCRVTQGGMAAAMRLIAGIPIDLNRATAADLELLHGIGPKLAAEIIRDREELGPFTSVDDLDRVKGIGPSKLGKMRPHVTVGPVESQ